MRNIVLGTAGHIDHGKTLLTKVLTGVDTDRLAEEKKRGITIEPGFAPLKINSEIQVSIVDVPGHERFIKNMMAGASGIDGVLFTAACDDGVMPQTREHLNIVDLLGIQRGIIVLTKSDLASQERIGEVSEQMRELVKGTVLEDADICVVSALNGTGIDELKEKIKELVFSIREKSTEKPFRLPADRSFQVSGFGNVVTGTLTEGIINTGEAAEIYPGEDIVSVRTIQHHNKNCETAEAGGRTAVSFKGLEREIKRGDAVCAPGSMITSKILDVRLTMTRDAAFKVKNSSYLHFFHGTNETVCKVRLLDADELAKGQSGYAQLFLEEPVSFRTGDRFVIRFYSPVITVGGGRILSGNKYRLRRNQKSVSERFSRLEKTESKEALLQRIEDRGLDPADMETIRMTGNMDRTEFDRICSELNGSGEIISIGTAGTVSKKALMGKYEEVTKQLEIYQSRYPLQPGMNIAGLRPVINRTDNGLANLIIDEYLREGLLKKKDSFISTPEFEPVFTNEHKIMQRKLLHYYKDAWFMAPDQNAVDEKFASRGIYYKQVLPNMKLNGKLIPLTKRYSVHHEAYAAAVELVKELCRKDGQVTIAGFRDAAGISRKFSQMYLEYFDKQGITRREGDVHVLL